MQTLDQVREEKSSHDPQTPVFSTIVFASNEAARIKATINMLHPYSEVIVLDNTSSDGTDLIAKAMGANVIKIKNDGQPSPEHIALAVQAATTSWILLTTCSEYLPSALIKELASIALDQGDLFDGAVFYRQSIINGMPSDNYKYSRRKPSKYNRRFCKKEFIDLSGSAIHNELNPIYSDDRVKIIPREPHLIMYQYRVDTISDLEKKHSRYGDIEAKHLYLKGRSFSMIRMFLGPTRAFITLFLRNISFRGFAHAALTAQLIFNIHLKIWEKERGFSADEYRLNNEKHKRKLQDCM